MSDCSTHAFDTPIAGRVVFDNGDEVPLKYARFQGRSVAFFEADGERYVPASLLAEWYGLALRNALDQYVEFDCWDSLAERTEEALG